MAGELYIPRQRLIDCSFEIDEAIQDVVGQGLDFRSDEALFVAGALAKKHLPELVNMSNEAVRVEGGSIVRWHEGEAAFMGGGSFQAVLGRVSLEMVTKTESIEGLDGEFVSTSYDLALVFRQQVVEPDPVDLVFCDELLAPMRDIETLLRAA